MIRLFDNLRQRVEDRIQYVKPEDEPSRPTCETPEYKALEEELIRAKKNGGRLIQIADALQRQGNLLNDDGYYRDALEKYMKVIDIRQKRFGDTSAKVAEAYYYTGISLSHLRAFPQAVEYLQKAVEIQKETRGNNSAELAASENLLGVCQLELGWVHDAHGSLWDALRIRRKLEDQHGIGETLCNMGLLHQRKRENKDALECFTKSLQIALEENDGELAERAVEGAVDRSKWVNGDKDEKTAILWQQYGLVLHSNGKYHDALEKFERALEIRQTIHGKNHASVAETRYSMGASYLELQNYSKAERAFKRSLDIRAKGCGLESAEVGDCKNMIGLLLCKQGRHVEAMVSLNEALGIRKALEDQDGVLETFSNINLVHNEMEQGEATTKAVIEGVSATLYGRKSILAGRVESTDEGSDAPGQKPPEKVESVEPVGVRKEIIEILQSEPAGEQKELGEGESNEEVHATVNDEEANGSGMETTKIASETTNPETTLNDAQQTYTDFGESTNSESLRVDAAFATAIQSWWRGYSTARAYQKQRISAVKIQNILRRKSAGVALQNIKLGQPTKAMEASATVTQSRWRASLAAETSKEQQLFPENTGEEAKSEFNVTAEAEMTSAEDEFRNLIDGYIGDIDETGLLGPWVVRGAIESLAKAQESGELSRPRPSRKVDDTNVTSINGGPVGHIEEKPEISDTPPAEKDKANDLAADVDQEATQTHAASARIIQNKWRAILASRTFKVQKASATMVQSLARQRIATIAVNSLKAARQDAQIKESSARVIQAQWRCHSSIRLFQRHKSSLIKVQALARMKMASKSVNNLRMVMQQDQINNASAMAIQSTWRGYTAAKGFKDEWASIVKIQSLAKKNLAVNSINSLRVAKQEYQKQAAARAIQAQWRCRSSVKSFQIQESSLIKIQSMVRMQRARISVGNIRMDKQQSQVKEASATIIQTKWRAYTAVSLFEKEIASVVKIQALARRNLAASSVNCFKAAKQKRKEETAAKTFQAQWRCYSSARSFQVQKSSIVKIQSVARMTLAAMALNTLRQEAKKRVQDEEEAAATALQSQFRLFLARKVSSEKKESLMKIQATARMILASKILSDLQQEAQRQSRAMESSATAIQAQWRSLAAVRFLQMQRAALIKLQAVARMRIAAKTLKYLENAKRQAELIDASVTAIQAWWRATVAAKSFKGEMISIKETDVDDNVAERSQIRALPESKPATPAEVDIDDMIESRAKYLSSNQEIDLDDMIDNRRLISGDIEKPVDIDLDDLIEGKSVRDPAERISSTACVVAERTHQRACTELDIDELESLYSNEIPSDSEDRSVVEKELPIVTPTRHKDMASEDEGGADRSKGNDFASLRSSDSDGSELIELDNEMEESSTERFENTGIAGPAEQINDLEGSSTERFENLSEADLFDMKLVDEPVTEDRRDLRVDNTANLAKLKSEAEEDEALKKQQAVPVPNSSLALLRQRMAKTALLLSQVESATKRDQETPKNLELLRERVQKTSSLLHQTPANLSGSWVSREDEEIVSQYITDDESQDNELTDWTPRKRSDGVSRIWGSNGFEQHNISDFEDFESSDDGEVDNEGDTSSGGVSC